MIWQLNPYALPFIGGALLLIYLCRLAWPRRERLAPRTFLGGVVALLAINLSYITRLFLINITLMTWLAKLELAIGLLLAVCWFLFVLAQTGHQTWIIRRRVYALFLPAIIGCLVIVTDIWHHQYFTIFYTEKVGGYVFLIYRYHYSLIYWIFVLYLLLLIFLSLLFTVQALFTYAAVFRNQALSMLLPFVLMVPALALDIVVGDRHPLHYLQLPYLAATLSISFIAWGLFRHRLMDLIPTAHSLVIHGIMDAVFVIDTEQRVVDANPAAAALLGKALTVIIGQPAEALFAEIGYPLAHWRDQEDINTQIRHGEGGQQRFFHLHFSPLRTQLGQRTGRVVLVRDVTTEKLLEEQAHALLLEKEEVQLLQSFIETMSHDLRTPVSTLTLSADLAATYLQRLAQQISALHTNPAQPDQATPATLEKQLALLSTNNQRIKSNTERLGRLMDAMLEMARLDKALTMKYATTNLNDLTQSAVHELQPLALTQQLTCTFISQPTLPIVTCDAAEVKRALHHLLVNALEFTPAGGKVTVSTAVDGEYALIRVADTGIGIPAADLPHIFERFYRVDKNRSTLTGGLGLGLAIVKKAITSQQGRVYVESTPESGSCFTIALPLQR